MNAPALRSLQGSGGLSPRSITTRSRPLSCDACVVGRERRFCLFFEHEITFLLRMEVINNSFLKQVTLTAQFLLEAAALLGMSRPDRINNSKATLFLFY
jgi:hypothetical protein